MRQYEPNRCMFESNIYVLCKFYVTFASRGLMQTFVLAKSEMKSKERNKDEKAAEAS